MSRGVRIARNIGIGVAALIVVLVAAALIVIPTDWFRNFAKEKIIAAIEDSTGGRAEVGSFEFSESNLRATVDGLVIHGLEPANAAPFVKVRRAAVTLRLFARLNQVVSVSRLIVQEPEVHVMMLPDGRSNVPTPKNSEPSKDSPLKPVVDLAIGHFELNQGVLTVEAEKVPLNVQVNNLKAQLEYNLLARTYGGNISFAPVYVMSGRKTPVLVTMAIPLTIGSDSIEVHHAVLSTKASSVSVDGKIENIREPKITARLNGTIATSDLKYATDAPISTNPKNVPVTIQVAADVTASKDVVHVANLQTSFGSSSMDASGDLKDPKGSGSLTFKSSLALTELARVFQITEPITGRLDVSGNAKLGAGNEYSVNGQVHGKGLGFQQGTTVIRNVEVASDIRVDQNNIELQNLMLSAFGGRFQGNASLQEMRRYQVNGNLRGFDIRSALNTIGQKLPYEGAITGTVSASGDINAAKSLTAQARVTIVPGKSGIPVSGKVNGDYSAVADDVRIQNSFVALPHTRLDLDGSLKKGLTLSLKTQDPNDLLAAAAVTGQPVSLNQGSITFDGMATGGVQAPRIAGHLGANRIVVEGRQFDSVVADLVASSTGAAVSNGAIMRAGATNGMRARFSGSVAMEDWKVPPSSAVSADLAIDQADLADLVVLAGEKGTEYTGAVTATAYVTGTVGNPLGSAIVEASKGTIQGQPFDQAHVQANLSDRLVTIPAAWIQSPAGRAELSGEFRHPVDSFTTGQVHAKVASTRIDLARAPIKLPRNATGIAQFNLDATGELKAVVQQGKTTSEFLLTAVNGNISGQDLKIDGEAYGNLDTTVRTSGQTTNYTATLTMAGSKVSVSGNTQLAPDNPTNADVTITDLAVAKILAAAERKDIPARGTLSGTAHVTGTLSKPQGNANLELTRAVVYDEPIERLRMRVEYLPDSIDVPQLQIAADGGTINLSAHYDHPAGNLETGTARFEINGSRIDLARIRNVQTRRPGLAGAVQLAAKGSGTIAAGQPRLLLRDLNLELSATGVKAQNENFGDLKLTASSAAGNKVEFAVDSNLADAQVHGKGTAEMSEGYPVNAQLSFTNVLYSRIVRLAGMDPSTMERMEAAADGQVSVNGPVLHTDQMRGNIQITRLAVTAKARPGVARPVSITNQGPMTATLDRGAVQIQSMHLSGSGVDLQAGGRASITGGPMALTLNGKVGLGVLEDFDSDIYSAGDVELTASVRGTSAQPLVNGQLVLKDATLSYAGLPNGISKANGTIVLSGSTANIQNLTAESGGGKLTLTGFAQYGEPMRFGIQMRATDVRVRVQPGISVIAGANVQLTGTSRTSLVSGTAVINQVTYNPTSDIASILSKAAPSVQSLAAPSPILENMRLDVRVRTASGLAVQAAIADGLSASADLRLQGNLARPGALGRVTLNEGKLVFLGSSFSVNSGTIAFYNPTQIDPILDVSLETQTQGIQVILRVTGSIDNMKLSYTSNPPLQFTEIVSLLATGKAPTSDPTLLANQPTTPQASFQQMGESAVLGQAVASPVAGRLQRVFGVSQLKIDPAFQGGSSVPTARLTLQQRITSNVTFTYTSALDDPNGQIIKVEWAFDPKWSAVATRDQNGIFSVNFFYKRQFK